MPRRAASTPPLGPDPALTTGRFPGGSPRGRYCAGRRPGDISGEFGATAEEIRLEGVSKVYADGTVGVAELDITFAAGELTVLVGPSGCGKTTTMKMINRIIEPTHRADPARRGGRHPGRPRPACADASATSSRASACSPTRRCAPTWAPFPACSAGTSTRIRARVDELLETVGLDPAVFGDRYPAQLSGGQRQRAGVARALAADPPVLLMDEPFSAVDPVVRERLQSEFLRLQETVRKTIVFVTHDIEEAVRIGDRIAVMSARRARRAVRDPRRAARPAGERLRGRLRRRRPRAQAPGGDRHRHRGPRAPAGRARRRRAGRRAGRARAVTAPAGPSSSTTTRTCTAGCRPSAPPGPGRSGRLPAAWRPGCRCDASLKTAIADDAPARGRLGRGARRRPLPRRPDARVAARRAAPLRRGRRPRDAPASV